MRREVGARVKQMAIREKRSQEKEKAIRAKFARA
jgi:hypothetical protein